MSHKLIIFKNNLWLIMTSLLYLMQKLQTLDKLLGNNPIMSMIVNILGNKIVQITAVAVLHHEPQFIIH